MKEANHTRRIRTRGRTTRLLLRAGGLGALAVALVALGACGGGSRREVVAEVAGHPISKAMLDHWTPIEAILATEAIPKHPAERGVVPDPPGYAACIAYTEAKKAKAGAVGASLSAETPKDECKKRYEAVRKHMLQILITFHWIEGEGAAQGVKVSTAEAREALEAYKRTQFGGEANFQRFLKYSGATLADELLVSRSNEFAEKLQKKIIAERGIAGARKFYERFPREWTAKTSCRRGYVIAECKQYHGSESPEASV